MLIPGRHEASGSYRYGFNGKENDYEIKGDGNSYDFGARMYDSRIGRWFSIDPKWRNFESSTPYNFVKNNPIRLIDIDGEAPIDPYYWLFKAVGLVRDSFTSREAAIKYSSSKDISKEKRKNIMYVIGLYDGGLSTIDYEEMTEDQVDMWFKFLKSRPWELSFAMQKSPENVFITILGFEGLGIMEQVEQINSIIANWDELDDYEKGQVHGAIIATIGPIVLEGARVSIPKVKAKISTNFKLKFNTSKTISRLISFEGKATKGHLVKHADVFGFTNSPQELQKMIPKLEEAVTKFVKGAEEIRIGKWDDTYDNVTFFRKGDNYLVKDNKTGNFVTAGKNASGNKKFNKAITIE